MTIYAPLSVRRPFPEMSLAALFQCRLGHGDDVFRRHVGQEGLVAGANDQAGPQ